MRDIETLINADVMHRFMTDEERAKLDAHYAHPSQTEPRELSSVEEDIRVLSAVLVAGLVVATGFNGNYFLPALVVIFFLLMP